MSKQTAVEWFIDKLNDLEVDLRLIPNHIEKAKAMEKEQMINTFKDAQVFKVMNNEIRAEQYYKKTYNNET